MSAKYRIEATIEGFSIKGEVLSLNLKGTTKYSIECISGITKEKTLWNLLELINVKKEIIDVYSEKDKVNVEVDTIVDPIYKHLLDHIFSERKKMVFILVESDKESDGKSAAGNPNEKPNENNIEELVKYYVEKYNAQTVGKPAKKFKLIEVAHLSS